MRPTSHLQQARNKTCPGGSRCVDVDLNFGVVKPLIIVVGNDGRVAHVEGVERYGGLFGSGGVTLAGGFFTGVAFGTPESFALEAMISLWSSLGSSASSLLGASSLLTSSSDTSSLLPTPIVDESRGSGF
jgi:hypothetical protein